MNKFASFALGIILSFLLLGIPYLAQEGYFKPVPYRVTNVTTSDIGGKTNVQVTFIKDECEWGKMVVVGRYFGLVEELDYSMAQHGDRIQGDYTINVLVDDRDRDYENIELRTRHLCGDDITSTDYDERTTVDRVLARVVPHHGQ